MRGCFVEMEGEDYVILGGWCRRWASAQVNKAKRERENSVAAAVFFRESEY